MGEMAAGEQPLNRRQSDRLLAAVEQSMLDRFAALADRLAILERDGSRGHAVLVQRVTSFERRVDDLVVAADKTHEAFDHSLREMEKHLDRIDEVVIKTNLDQLPARVGVLEVTGERRGGLTAGIRTAVGIYAMVAVAAGSLVLQVVLK